MNTLTSNQSIDLEKVQALPSSLRQIIQTIYETKDCPQLG